MSEPITNVSSLVELSAEATAALKKLAKERGIAEVDVLKHALELEIYLSDVVRNKGKVLIEKNGELRKIAFPR